MTEEEVVGSFEAAEPVLETYLGMNDEMVEALQEKENMEGQPEVLKYIIEELFMAEDLEPALEADEQIHLFMICKFFVDSLHTLAKETAPETIKH
ncbi:hypothetical protein D3C87_1773610 [compost metagenome]